MNNFSCWSFIEFYLIESAIYEISTLPSEKHFLDSYQYLTKKIEEYHKPFTEAFALTLRDYLWFAALGEARHSGRNIAEYIPEFDGYLSDSRDSVYSNLAIDYQPTKHNRTIVYNLFNNYNWSSTYGGDNWANIVKSIGLYHKIPAPAFIDHCADLQHNGGVAFDKGSVPFWDMAGYVELMNFLTFKFQTPHLIFDILREYKWKVISNQISKYSAYIFNKTHAMCRTHDRRLRPSKIKYDLYPDSRYSGDYSLSESIEGGCGYSCYNCGSSYDEDEMYWNDDNGKHYCCSCVYTCESCSDTIFDDDYYVTASSGIICNDCYYNNYFTCDGCDETHDNEYSHEHDGCSYCEDCYTNLIEECAKCGELFLEDEMVYDDAYYCEECHNKLTCDCCDTQVEEKLPIKFLDQYPYYKHLSFTEELICLDCIKKYLDTGHDIWHSTRGLVMSENIKEVLRYPYKDTLKVHLIKEFTYEELVDTTQRRLL
jgi:hypothetical protein